MHVTVFDKMQHGYEYDRTEEEGKNFTFGFEPELSPAEMLELGVFEGKYLTDCLNEFPKRWFEKAKMSFSVPDVSLNCFGVKSRMGLSEWRAKGWIIEPDPRGWFQWYCRYYSGRRIPGVDEIQIKRWKAFKRHKAQVERNCMPADATCRPRQRQALLQWAYDQFV